MPLVVMVNVGIVEARKTKFVERFCEDKMPLTNRRSIKNRINGEHAGHPGMYLRQETIEVQN